MSNAKPNENLKRTIDPFGLACAVVNIIIGTGIYVLPALVAERLGAAAILCFLICGLLIFLIALCFAEVGSKITVSGGSYAYIEAAFGPFIGFLANNLFWFGSCVFSDAAVANALAKSLTYFYPPLDSTPVRPVFFLLLFGGLAFVNIRGVNSGLKMVIGTTLAKLAPLILLILFGIGHVVPANLHWQNTFTIQDIGAATLTLFYAFLGIETAVTNGGEFKNPSRVVPLGICSGLLVVLVIYIAIQLVTQGVLGVALRNANEAPLAAVAKKLFGSGGVVIITIGAAVSMLGCISGEIMAIPRILFAGARDKLLPSFLATVHPRFRTPHWAILVYATLGYLFAVFGTFRQLLMLTTAATLLIYLGVVLATIKLRRKEDREEKSFIIPGGLIVPFLAMAIIVWLLSNLALQEWIAVSVALMSLSVVYALLKWNKDRQGRLFTTK